MAQGDFFHTVLTSFRVSSTFVLAIVSFTYLNEYTCLEPLLERLILFALLAPAHSLLLSVDNSFLKRALSDSKSS